MAIILNIDTAVETASVCLAKEGKSIQFAINNDQRDHAAWLHSAIQAMTAAAGVDLKDIQAVAVTIGPGSYTGLRVGLSAAKGLCFALQIPLIAINTLEMMAYSVKNGATGLICPVIDARRMEVFTAIYTQEMSEIITPCAMIVQSHSFDSWLVKNKVIFVGNGIKKLQPIIVHSNAIFNNIVVTSSNMVHMAEDLFIKQQFAHLIRVEPFYIKEFYSLPRQ
jgi:tRNA threonylcarbamoyladenosine biosynthesis protein TsaB